MVNSALWSTVMVGFFTEQNVRWPTSVMKKFKPDIFCYGMLIYPTFYQRWVDSYVKYSIIYKRKRYHQEKNQHAVKNSKAQ